MSGKETEQSLIGKMDDDRRGLRNGVIVFAIIEALALIPLVAYLSLR